jgi:hypothetical protein
MLLVAPLWSNMGHWQHAIQQVLGQSHATSMVSLKRGSEEHGSPWGFFAQPIPVPTNTHTHAYGCGF